MEPGERERRQRAGDQERNDDVLRGSRVVPYACGELRENHGQGRDVAHAGHDTGIGHVG